MSGKLKVKSDENILAGESVENSSPAEQAGPRAPKTNSDWNQLGVKFKTDGDLQKSLACYRKALEIGPEHPGIWSNVGNAMTELGKFPNAIVSHQRALKLDPTNEILKNNMVQTLVTAGAALKAEKKFKESLFCYQEALKLTPRQAGIWANLGRLLLDIAKDRIPASSKGKSDYSQLNEKSEAWKLMDGAIRSLRIATKLEPENAKFAVALAGALNMMGVALRAKRQFRAALAHCKEALSVAPDLAGSWSNLGNVLKDMKYIESSITCHKRAVEFAPESSDCLFNLAVAYSTGMRSEEALKTLDKALIFKPNDPDLRWDRALSNLRLGNYAEGFKDYEARLETGALPNRNPPGKPWMGENYAGETLLIVSEQGYGDTIWASRYLGRVKALGGNLIVECRKDMMPLIESMVIADRVIAKGSPFPAADWHINICSLPGLFVKTAEDISGAPYIKPPADRLEKARAAIGDAKGTLKVGIVWSGSTTFRGNNDRAVPLRMFLDAFSLPGIQLYSLQKGPPAEDLKVIKNPYIIDLAPAIEDFADAAAFVANLDLIIMTDSAVAHLAGAVGKPVWVLLNYSPYWIWGSGGGSSVWYDSVEVFRQLKWMSWHAIFDRAAANLIGVD